MEEIGSSTSTPLSNHKKTSLVSRLRKSCSSFAASLQESFRYVKAFFVGQAKTITARNEKEASAAELEAAKMQVEAAADAEDIKSKLNKSDRTSRTLLPSAPHSTTVALRSTVRCLTHHHDTSIHSRPQ